MKTLSFGNPFRIGVLSLGLLLLAACGGGGGGSGSGSGSAAPTLSAFSPASVAPAEVLTLSGQNFNSAAQLQLLLSDGNGYQATVPVIVSSSTSLQAVIPPYYNASGSFTGGTLSVQLQQTLNGNTVNSNILGNLQVQAPPTSVVTPGTLLLAFLQASLSQAQGLQSSIQGTRLNTTQTQNLLSSQISRLNTLISNVQSLMDGSSTSFTMGQLNGTTITVTAANLVQVDQLLLAVLQSYAGPPPTFGSPAASAMLAQTTSTLNVVQSAAYAAYTAATTPGISLNSLNGAVANWSTELAQYVVNHPKQAEYYTTLGIAIGFTFIDPIAAMDLMSEGVVELLSDVSLKEALDEITTAAIDWCANGFRTLVDAINQIKQGIGTKVLEKLGGNITDWIGQVQDVITIVQNQGCSGGGGTAVTITSATCTILGTNGSINQYQIAASGSATGPLNTTFNWGGVEYPSGSIGLNCTSWTTNPFGTGAGGGTGSCERTTGQPATTEWNISSSFSFVGDTTSSLVVSANSGSGVSSSNSASIYCGPPQP